MDRIETLVDHAPCLTCPQHRTSGAGCAVVEAGSDVSLDAFVSREPCYLKEQLRRFAARYLAHRPRSLVDAEDLTQDVLARLLGDPEVRRGGFGRGLGAFLAYLRQTAVRCAITAERRERGRVRCGSCRHFGAWSGICLQEGHAWTHREVPASGDPRKLAPPCGAFVARREPHALGDEATTIAGEGARFAEDHVTDVAEAVHRALLRLAEAHPRAALVVRARLLDGRGYDDLAEVAASVRTMKRDYAFGVEFLRNQLRAYDLDVDPAQPGSDGVDEGRAGARRESPHGRSEGVSADPSAARRESVSRGDAAGRLRRVERTES